MQRKKRKLNSTLCTIQTYTIPRLFARLAFKAAVFHLSDLNQGSPFYSISLTEIAPEFLHHAYVDLIAYGFQAVLTGRIQNRLEHLPSFS